MIHRLKIVALAAGDRTQDTERLRPVRQVGKSDRQQRERGGREQCPEDPLKSPRTDEHPERLRQAAEHGGERESYEAGDERPLAAEQIAELAPE